MRAVIVERFGPLADAQVRQVDPPAPGPKQVLIEAQNAGVNFPDLLMISGTYQVKPELPFTPGRDSGLIQRVPAAGNRAARNGLSHRGSSAPHGPVPDRSWR